MQFSNCFKSPDHVHALDINPDVALWLDSHSYDSKPQLHEASGFVIVNPMLHSEVEAFEAALSTPECNNLRLGPLLQYWKDFVRPSCGDVLTMLEVSTSGCTMQKLTTYVNGYWTAERHVRQEQPWKTS